MNLGSEGLKKFFFLDLERAWVFGMFSGQIGSTFGLLEDIRSSIFLDEPDSTKFEVRPIKFEAV